MDEQLGFEEVSDLRKQIKNQSLQVENIYQEINQQASRLSHAAPVTDILKKWIQEMTYFGQMEINEVVRIESFFPGCIKKAIERARLDFNRNIYFDDFISSAKTIALQYLEGQISDEQREILQKVIFNTMEISWGEIKEYNQENLSLVPKDLQDLFARYIYNGTEELELKVIEQARIVYVMHVTEIG